VASPSIPQASADATPSSDAPVATVSSAKPIATSGLRRVLGVLRRHLALVISIVVVAAIAGMFGPRLVLGPSVVVEAAARANFVQSVVATGRACSLAPTGALFVRLPRLVAGQTGRGAVSSKRRRGKISTTVIGISSTGVENG